MPGDDGHIIMLPCDWLSFDQTRDYKYEGRDLVFDMTCMIMAIWTFVAISLIVIIVKLSHISSYILRWSLKGLFEIDWASSRKGNVQKCVSKCSCMLLVVKILLLIAIIVF